MPAASFSPARPGAGRDITVGISTGGSSPTIAQYLKAKFREDIPEGFGDLAVQLGSYRQMVKEQVPEIALRTEIFREMVDAGIAGGCFLSREEAQSLIHRKKREYQENREDQGTRENQEKRQVRIGTRKSELAVVQTRLAGGGPGGEESVGSDGAGDQGDPGGPDFK